MASGMLRMGVGEVRAALRSNSVAVCVVGVGRIGLPTALSFANKGLRVTGLDIDAGLVGRLNAGDYPLRDEPHYGRIFDLVLAEGRFSATTDAGAAMSGADVVLLSLPTPMDGGNVPDYSALRDVGAQLNRFLPEGSLVIVESTVEPGFIEDELVGIIEGSDGRLEAGRNFGIGACPENANPGEILEYTNTRPRLVGSISAEVTGIISELYQHVFPVKMIRLADCKTANAVKLTGNVFRDVNIAFVNELSMMFEKMGIDTYEVIEAAKAKRMFLAHDPGAGVGGPCIPVNSYQLLNSARSTSSSLGVIEAARRTNEGMPSHVIRLVEDALGEAGRDLAGSAVLVLGVTYKPDVRDIQLTPAEPIVDGLREGGSAVRVFDPLFRGEEVFGVAVEDGPYGGAEGCDCAVIVTNHSEFSHIDLARLASSMRTPILVDARGRVSRAEAERAGFSFRGLGR